MTTTVRFLGSGDSFGSGGRFQTCILVESPAPAGPPASPPTRFLLDCGASSLIAMRAQGVDPNSIDVILLTHFHGDHCAGVPFLLIDAMLGSKRQRPLVVAGPPGTRERIGEMREVLFPGSARMTPKFPLEFVAMQLNAPNRIGDLDVTPYPALHTPETVPTILRVEAAGKVITYTGDTDWTDALIPAAAGADLLICECYYYEKAIRMHMNYATLRAHRSRLDARMIVLTHMADDMLAHVPSIPERCASDGMVLTL
jgi:ribonuclease BN (tRNA processing enzyme)